MEDYSAFLRDNDAQIVREREQRAAAYAAKKAAEKEYSDAWESVFVALKTGDENPVATPDLSPILDFARLIVSRDWHLWLPKMAANIAASIDHEMSWRPAQLFFVDLLIAAVQPDATTEQIANKYEAFIPQVSPPYWRVNGARDVQDFFTVRISQIDVEAARAEAEAAAKARESRSLDLQAAARRRPALEKQLFAVYWTNKGLGPAPIRDKWNKTHAAGDSVGSGATGRRDISAAIRRGREFLAEQSTTIEEMSALLGIIFGD